MCSSGRNDKNQNRNYVARMIQKQKQLKIRQQHWFVLLSLQRHMSKTLPFTRNIIIIIINYTYLAIFALIYCVAHAASGPRGRVGVSLMKHT